MFFFNFVIFLTRGTRLRISMFGVDLCKNLIVRVVLATVLQSNSAFAQIESERKRFGILKEERKSTEKSEHRRPGLSNVKRHVSKLSQIRCTCLALSFAITARAGHFTD